MATTRQVLAARRNVKKAQAGARKKRTIANLPKSTRRGQAEARKGARRHGHAGHALEDRNRQQLYEIAKERGDPRPLEDGQVGPDRRDPRTTLEPGRKAGCSLLMAVAITREQALAWRTRRQLLSPPGVLSVTKVVARLSGVQAQVASSAELAVRVRRERSRPGEVGRAVAQGLSSRPGRCAATLHLRPRTAPSSSR
jgi:hypothetical protein